MSLLECSLAGSSVTLDLAPDSHLAALYEAGGWSSTPVEQTTCNYGLDVSVQDIASSHGMRAAAVDDTGEVRAVELVDHPFFVATLYMPQLTSTPDTPHPVFTGFVAAMGV